MRPLFICLALGAIALLAACGKPEPETKQQVEPPRPRHVIQDRFKIYDSELDHSGTVSRLLEALDRRDLTVFALIDHQAGAISVGMELPPMTLVIFGSPQTGTPLMAEEPLLGAELPMRALIYDEDGQTKLAITGMGFLGREYGLSEQRPLLKRTSDVLEILAQEATTA